MTIPTDVLNVIVSSAAALFTLAAGALVWWQASQHFRHTRSASYIERFNTSEYFAARLEVDRLISEDASFEALIRAEVGKESDQLERDRLHVLMFANLFQEIGAAYRVGLVDQRYTWSVFGYLGQHYWQKLSPFILRLRAIRRRPELYRDFEYLCSEMAKLDRKYARYNDPKFNPRFSPANSEFLFAYGSLMDPKSFNRSFWTRTPERFEQARLARLYGFERGWFAFSQVRFRAGSEPRDALMAFLGLRSHSESYCNGTLIPLRRGDIAKLDRREKGYTRIDVTPLVFPSVDGRVFTYLIDSKEAKLPDAVVAHTYAEGVERSAALYGDLFLSEFRKTTMHHAYPVRTGDYDFADSSQNEAAGRGGGIT